LKTAEATLSEKPKERHPDRDTASGRFTARVAPMKYRKYPAAGLPIATGVGEDAAATS